MLLRKTDILDYVNSDVAEPSDDNEKIQWKENKILAKKIVIDSVKDHLVPLISKPESAKDMFKALNNLYEFYNTNRVLALIRRRLLHVKMTIGESMVSDFMKITKLKDQLSAISETFSDKDLVMLA